MERDRELASLEGLIDDAANGRASLALVEGPAGIGKTSLMIETRRLAGEAGLCVLTARGSELEREFPFGVVRQLFEPLLAEPERRDRVLGGAAATAAPVFEVVEQAEEELGGDGSFAVLHGLYWLTVNLTADGPLLLAVDDLHWCDRPSLRFLAYLARRLEGLPALVACEHAPLRAGRRRRAARRARRRSAQLLRPPRRAERGGCARARARRARRGRATLPSPPPATPPRAATRCCSRSC